MAYIIHGASGAQGSPVLTAMHKAGFEVKAATRNAASIPQGITAVHTDYMDISSLVDAYTGAEGVFLHLPMGDPVVLAEAASNIVAALTQTQPARVVISTSGHVLDRPDLVLQSPPGSPIRILIEGVNGLDGVSSAVIATRLYLENLHLPVFAELIHREGILRYPLPADFRVSWASHQDVAALAVELFKQPDITGIVGLGAMPGLTGTQVAEEIGSALKKEVRYEAITPDQFGDLITPIFGEGAASGVVEMYRAINAAPSHELDPATTSQQVMNFAPMSVAQWVKATW